MTAPAVPANARTIVASAICQQIIRERDEPQDTSSRYREFITHLGADHGDNGHGFCTGDHAAMFVPFPCEIRDACDDLLGSTS